MVVHDRSLCAVALWCALFAPPAFGQEVPSGRPGVPAQDFREQAPTPLEDDAALHDVQFIGPRLGWAVGDHGVIWRTDDGGGTWRLIDSPVRCSLRSICFLTDRVGWIAGGGTTPHTRVGYGVVLFTDDGGATWQQLARNVLPQLVYIRFFGLEEGVAVGEPLPGHPAGVFHTRDGGKSWQPLDASQASQGDGASEPLQSNAVGGSWRAADFIAADLGVVAGRRGKVALADGNQLLSPRIGDLGLRGFRGIRLHQDLTGWLVGDGGLVLRTENGGVVWQAPPTPLPNELRDTADFRTVEMRGEKAWIAGSPGSVIWHTPDAGRTWTKQFTGQTAPIHRIRFISETQGWAVGALGLMLATADGGQTWHAVRGSDRRVALLALHARAERISFPLLVQQSGDQGYRSAALIPVRRDTGPNGHDRREADLQLHDAVTAAGGSAGEFGWQFPVEIPGLDLNGERLVEEWNRRTEGRLAGVLLGRLVCNLRTWRPSVIVLDQAPPDDATTALLNEAVLRAVAQAADPTRFVEQFQHLGLRPWRVERVYVRLPAGSTGQAHVDLHEYLPRLKTTVQLAAATAATRAVDLPRQTAVREAYRLVYQADSNSDLAGPVIGPDELQPAGPLGVRPASMERDSSGIVQFFTGIAIAPGSDARRRLLPINEAEDAIHRKLAERQRNFQAYSERFLDDSRQAAQVIAQLTEITAGMPNEQAALQLVQLAEDYRRRSQWELVEATLVELINRYPQEPVTHEAMCWLLQYWIGAEPAYQRTRGIEATRHQATTGVRLDETAARVARVLAVANADLTELNPALFGADPLQDAAGGLDAVIGGSTTTEQQWRTGAVRSWHQQALRLGAVLRRLAPALYRTPEVQFPLAALLRQHGMPANFYERYHAGGNSRRSPHERRSGDDPWTQTAQAEQWLNQGASLPPKPVAVCRFTSERPLLDGVLSDACWRKAKVIPLSADGRAAEGERGREGEGEIVDGAFAMLAYDLDFLYFAVSVPRASGAPDHGPQPAGRKHDADLSRHDRVALFLDVDRDYSTYYLLEVDQRGWTTDACWGDATWNPQWYVAADNEGGRWRIEAAIPLKEMVPMMPVKDDVWALGLVRTIPAVGLESWTRPPATEPRPETFGLLRFDSENDR